MAVFRMLGIKLSPIGSCWKTLSMIRAWRQAGIVKAPIFTISWPLEAHVYIVPDGNRNLRWKSSRRGEYPHSPDYLYGTSYYA
jgi:hypothetical protein